MGILSGPEKMAFSGGIAAGKSTAVEIFGDLTGAVTYGEPALEDSYLEDFCADPKRYALEFQMYVQSERERIQRDAMKHPLFVMDRFQGEDVVFAKTQHVMGYIDERAFTKVYLPHFKAVRRNMQKLDVIIYLDISAEESMRRIVARGRECEQSYTMAYLQTLGEEYESWLPQVAKKTPVYKIDACQIYVEQGSEAEKRNAIEKNIKRLLKVVQKKFAEERPTKGLFELQI